MKKLFILSILFLIVNIGISQTFTGKFVVGSCSDNACLCGECFYKFINDNGIEMTFDKGLQDFPILELTENDEGGLSEEKLNNEKLNKI